MMLELSGPCFGYPSYEEAVVTSRKPVYRSRLLSLPGAWMTSLPAGSMEASEVDQPASDALVTSHSVPHWTNSGETIQYMQVIILGPALSDRLMQICRPTYHKGASDKS